MVTGDLLDVKEVNEELLEKQLPLKDTSLEMKNEKLSTYSSSFSQDLMPLTGQSKLLNETM